MNPIRDYSEISWENDAKFGRIKKLKVKELQGYIEHHELDAPKMKKAELAEYVTNHILKNPSKK